MPIPIVLRPPVRKSRVSGHSVLVPTNSFILTIQVAQAVDVAVALRCVRTVHGFFAEDDCFASDFQVRTVKTGNGQTYCATNTPSPSR
jgi:hypothetical protein